MPLFFFVWSNIIQDFKLFELQVRGYDKMENFFENNLQAQADNDAPWFIFCKHQIPQKLKELNKTFYYKILCFLSREVVLEKPR